MLKVEHNITRMSKLRHSHLSLLPQAMDSEHYDRLRHIGRPCSSTARPYFQVFVQRVTA